MDTGGQESGQATGGAAALWGHSQKTGVTQNLLPVMSED
jgi:hypothetical protein